MFQKFMSTAASMHLARASKAARLLKEATSQEEAALLMDAGLAELSAALRAAPKTIAERVQRVANDIAQQMMSVVNQDALAEAIKAAHTT